MGKKKRMHVESSVGMRTKEKSSSSNMGYINNDWNQKIKTRNTGILFKYIKVT